MPRYDVRPLLPGDFADLMAIEEHVFGGSGEDVLGPYYVRLCCEFFADSCFVARAKDARGESVVAGYLLSFIKGTECYCTTLAVHPDFQGSRVVLRLLQVFVSRLRDVESVWFTVKEDNVAARALHELLGAREIGMRHDFYGPGDERIVAVIDRSTLRDLRERYRRLGLVDAPAGVVEEAPLRLVAGGKP